MAATLSPRHVAHDHIVFLLGKDDFENLPNWLTDNFNVIEGGTHAGGSSRNKLIVFKDGTYLELFSWIHEPKEFLDWADKPPGLIDFALTTTAPINAQQNYISLTQALEADDGELGVRFDHPRAGGRKRRDGIDVKWETTRAVYFDAGHTPESSFFPTKRLDAPFFCHDITSRSARVPFEDDHITTHPCGAIGIGGVEVLVPESHFKYYRALYHAILGTEDSTHAEKTGPQIATYSIVTPNEQSHSTVVRLKAASPTGDDAAHRLDRAWLDNRGIGIRRLVLTTQQGGDDLDKTRGLDNSSTNATDATVLLCL